MNDILDDLQKRFAGAADFSVRRLRIAGTDCVLCFLDGLVSGADVADFVLRPLIRLPGPLSPAFLLERAVTGGAIFSASSTRPASARCRW